MYYNDTNVSKEELQECIKKNDVIHSIHTTYDYTDTKCLNKTFNYLFPKTIIGVAKKNNEEFNVCKPDIIFPAVKEAILISEAVLAWGVEDNMDFEKNIAKAYKKKVNVFDCSMKDEDIKAYNKINEQEGIKEKVILKSECLGTDKYIMPYQKTSGKTHSLSEKLKELKLENKMVYLKLGIPETHEYIDDIIKNKENISGMSLAFEMLSPKYIAESAKAIEKLNEHFVIVGKTNFYPIRTFELDSAFVSKEWVAGLALAYVNKNLIDDYKYSWNQKAPRYNYCIHYGMSEKYYDISIDSDVVLWEKLRKFTPKVQN